MKIQELALDERPREKLLKLGPEVLSGTELLAVLLRTGTGKENAVEVARNLLRAAGGSFVKLSSMTAARMGHISGVGPLKAASIMAAIEIGRRFAAEGFPCSKTPVDRPSAIFQMMLPRLKGLDHEQCWVIYLNRSKYVVDSEMVSDGGLSETIVDIKMIIRNALEKKASGIVLVHNHPSGNPHPGAADINITKALGQAARLMGLNLLDHIIISDSAYFSFNSEVAVQLDDDSRLL